MILFKNPHRILISALYPKKICKFPQRESISSEMIKKFTSYHLSDHSPGVYDQILFEPIKVTDFPNFKPESGYLYVSTRGVSSRVNANYDGWPIDELKKSYKTFLGRPVHLEHNNLNYKKAKGIITDVLYREYKTAAGLKDAGVYLLLEIDAKTFPRLAHAIETGKINGVSMGAEVDHTSCSVCGNKASEPKEYCWHVAAQKGQTLTYKKGNKVVESLVYENCHGINFFELSAVFDPADESSFVLDKRYIP